MWSAADKDRDSWVPSPGRMDFLTALSVLFTPHKHRRCVFFSFVCFPKQTDARGNSLIGNEKHASDWSEYKPGPMNWEEASGGRNYTMTSCKTQFVASFLFMRLNWSVHFISLQVLISVKMCALNASLEMSLLNYCHNGQIYAQAVFRRLIALSGINCTAILI